MRSPPYLTELLTRLPAELSGDQLFLHLGHFVDGNTDMRRAQRRMNEELLGRSALEPGNAVLDVGCGIGGTLAAVGAGFDRVGVNIGADQLAVAERSVPGVRWVHADATQLPFEDDSFDRILCIEAAFHFSSRRAFFREVARVMRPNGRLVMSDILIHSGAPADIVALVTEGLAPWPDPLRSPESLPEIAAPLELEIDDVTSAVAPSFSALMGVDALADPRGCTDGGDRGTAALGHLCQLGLLSVVYATGQLKTA